MTRRPRLLFLSQTLPYPPDGGVNIRTFNVLKILSARYDIDLLCFFRKRVVHDLQQSLEGLRPFVRSVQVFPIEQERSKARFIQDHLSSVTLGRAYTHYAYHSRAFQEALRSLVVSGPDLVHIDSLDLAAYIESVSHIPTVVTHHNVESQLLKRRAKIETRWPYAHYFSLQADLLEHIEKQFVPAVSLNLVCSANDMSTLAELTGARNILVVPNGVDTEYFRGSGSTEEDNCIGVGGTTWFPNKDALDYLYHDILPAVRHRSAKPKFHWVGRAAEHEVKLGASRGVTLYGYVSDIRPYVDRASCFIAPLRVGGGTRLKLLDAWSMGKAIVSTSIGCEGISAVDGENILVRDDADGFADAVIEVLTDAALRKRLEISARLTAEDHYSWATIGRRILEAYAEIEVSRSQSTSTYSRRRDQVR